MAKRILVPLDRREHAESVLPLVADMARGAGATVRLMHVAPLPLTRMDAYGRVIAYANQEMESLRAQGLDYLETAEARLPGIPVERRVRFGDATEEILLEAEAFGAELIALAGPPRRWWRPRNLRGVARRVWKKATAPVMLVTAN